MDRVEGAGIANGSSSEIGKYTMSFGDWLQQRRVHALVLTIPICTVAYAVGAVIFRIFPLTQSALLSKRFLVSAIFWGVCMGVILAFTLRPPHWLKND